MSKENVAVSKFLSLVLRHAPETIGLELDAQGWAPIAELIRCAEAHGRPLSRASILDVVRSSSKKRFALSEDQTRIRANQGHSIAVDLGLEPRTPPAQLFHGTARRFVESIRAHGLEPRSRQHVHLSADRATAHSVGARHGAPVVLSVASGAMHQAGLVFYRSANGVWLTGIVPPQYIASTHAD